MSRTLPPLSEAQRRWAADTFAAIGKALYKKKGEVWCQHCGHVEQKQREVLLIDIACGYVCPRCGKELEPVADTCRKVNEYERYFSVITCKDDYNVVRVYRQQHTVRRGEACTNMYEVFQCWIDEHGRETIIGRRAVQSYYYTKWKGDADFYPINRPNRGYGHVDIYSDYGADVYPIARVTPLLKRNGWSRELLKLRAEKSGVIRRLLSVVQFETLAKTGQYRLLDEETLRGNHTVRYMPQICICNRRGYIVDNPEMWYDTIHMLARLGMDIRNPRYLCPPDLKALHDRLDRRLHDRERKNARQERMERIRAAEAVYQSEKGRFFGISFGNTDIDIHVVRSVAEMADEGDEMHHCVFEAGYYKRPDSLILSATDHQGRRLETIEVNLNTLRVVQSRGVCNRETARHKEIIALVNKNMNLIQKAI